MVKTNTGIVANQEVALHVTGTRLKNKIENPIPEQTLPEAALQVQTTRLREKTAFPDTENPNLEELSEDENRSPRGYAKEQEFDVDLTMYRGSQQVQNFPNNNALELTGQQESPALQSTGSRIKQQDTTQQIPNIAEQQPVQAHEPAVSSAPKLKPAIFLQAELPEQPTSPLSANEPAPQEPEEMHIAPVTSSTPLYKNRQASIAPQPLIENDGLCDIHKTPFTIDANKHEVTIPKMPVDNAAKELVSIVTTAFLTNLFSMLNDSEDPFDLPANTFQFKVSGNSEIAKCMYHQLAVAFGQTTDLSKNLSDQEYTKSKEIIKSIYGSDIKNIIQAAYFDGNDQQITKCINQQNAKASNTIDIKTGILQHLFLSDSPAGGKLPDDIMKKMDKSIKGKKSATKPH